MASKRLQRRKQCTGKVKYTVDTVHAMLDSKHQGLGLHSYKCKFCGSWHVGRMSLEYKAKVDNR